MIKEKNECIHPPRSGHQKKIWDKALELKKTKVTQEDARSMINEEWQGYHQDVRQAVDRAVERVYSSKLKKDKGKKPWPAVDEDELRAIAEEKPYSLEDLRNDSPYPASELSKIPPCGLLQLLFPKDSLICLGESVESSSTKTLEEFCASEKNLRFTVPRTMRNEFGISQDGQVSPRCNDNAGPERYVVIEFDDMEGDVQISMIKHLSQFLPLVLVLHSGGKSFHAWFNGCTASEDRVLAFRRHAASLGADKAVFTKCQMVRMPNQNREKNGNLQELHYLDLSKLPSSSAGAPSIDFDEYPFCPEKGLSKKDGIRVPHIQDWNAFKKNCLPEPPELVAGFIHKGCKGVLCGQSKAGKSHLAMQLLDTVSKGEDFLGMATTKSKVLYLNLELPDFGLKKRFEALHAKSETTPHEDMLFVANGRGNWSGIKSLEGMIEPIKEMGIEMVIIDPLYKVADIDESDQARVKEVLRVFDDITQLTGAAVLYVHHFTKGKASEKSTIDLLAGSGVLARDYDSCILLLEGEGGKSMAKFILRSHTPKADIPLKDVYPLKVVDESEIGGDGGVLEARFDPACGNEKYSEIRTMFGDEEELSSKELLKIMSEDHGMKKSASYAFIKKAKENGLLSETKKGRHNSYRISRSFLQSNEV